MERVRRGETALFDIITRWYNQRFYRVARAIVGDDVYQALARARRVGRFAEIENDMPLSDSTSSSPEDASPSGPLFPARALTRKVGAAVRESFAFGFARCDRVVGQVLTQIQACTPPPGGPRALTRRSKMRHVMIAALGLVLTAGVTTARADEKGGQKDMTVSGEVVDTYCYAAMGARGASHRQCGLDCAKKGIPVGLAEKGTDKLYVLLPNKDKTALPEAVVDKMGETVTVTGHAHTKGGSNFLTVESVK